MRLGDNQAMDIEAISTGSLTIDIALGMAARHVDELLKSTARIIR